MKKEAKNIDGIQKSNFGRKNNKASNFFVSDIRCVKKPLKALKTQTFFVVPAEQKTKQAKGVLPFKSFYSQKKVPVLVAVLGLILAFGSGMWAVLDTRNTAAEIQPQVLGAYTSEPNSIASAPSGPLVAGSQLQGQDSSIAADILFNTPIQYLQNYFQSVSQPDVINLRKNQLEQFLKQHNSPFAQAAETIAEQDHWKLILAIAFAESTLGKNCTDNNCSNIGVKPGAPSWRQYSNYSRWVVDFNRLLDKKYKDWTLEQMCGVYVQPCNPNWLAATKQILNELQEQGIE